MTDEFEKKLLEKYTKSSVLEIHKTVNYLSKRVGHELTWDDIKTDISDHMNSLAKSTRDARLGYLMCICKVKNIDVPSWMETSKQSNSKHLKEERSKKAGDKHDFIDPKDIYQYYNGLIDKKTIDNLQANVMFSILKQVPLRLNEMRELKYNKDAMNHVDLDKRKIVIRLHKTSRRGGAIREYDLNKDSINAIKLLKENSKGDQLFTYNRKGNSRAFTQQEFRDWFKARINKYGKAKNVITKGMGIHSFRHYHVSKKMGDLGISQDTYKKLEVLAKNMGHTVGTALDHYLKSM